MRICENLPNVDILKKIKKKSENLFGIGIFEIYLNN